MFRFGKNVLKLLDSVNGSLLTVNKILAAKNEFKGIGNSVNIDEILKSSNGAKVYREIAKNENNDKQNLNKSDKVHFTPIRVDSPSKGGINIKGKYVIYLKSLKLVIKHKLLMEKSLLNL
jgi:hypothetical protein